MGYYVGFFAVLVVQCERNNIMDAGPRARKTDAVVPFLFANVTDRAYPHHTIPFIAETKGFFLEAWG